MPAQTARGKRIEAAYYAALQRQALSRSTLVATITSAAINRPPGTSRFGWVESTQPLAPPAVVPATSTPKSPMALDLRNIIGNVANAVGGIFGSAPTSTGPTTATTFGTVTSAVGSVIGAVLPGGPAVNAATAVATLPGRTTGGGMSEFLLERPTGTGGAAMSGLARLGIPPGWSRKKIKALVRYVGPAQAAAIIGAPLESVAIVAVSTHSRSRGISARDLRVTRRVTRRVLGIARDLAAIRPPAARRAPSRGTRVICN